MDLLDGLGMGSFHGGYMDRSLFQSRSEDHSRELAIGSLKTLPPLACPTISGGTSWAPFPVLFPAFPALAALGRTNLGGWTARLGSPRVGGRGAIRPGSGSGERKQVELDEG